LNSPNAADENPFANPSVAARYEDWYLGEGAVADRLEKSVLRELLERFPRAASVLEVGCGTGHFTRWFEQQGLAAVGLDISAPMLQQARRRGSKSCIRASADALPFGDATFDLVALIATLEFLAEPARALEEAVRVARRGVVIGTLNRWSLYAWRRRLRSSAVWRRARFWGPIEVRRLVLRAAGGRAREFLWRSTSWTLPFHVKPRAVPCGDFIGAALLLAEND
jgi:ubiquinone/menaquinone biosynthesis C-methylase UbiE